jgi:glucose-6-phosphate 1-epimerase
MTLSSGPWYNQSQNKLMPTGETEQGIKPGSPGRVAFLDGQSEMPMLEVTTAWSSAEIYLHGAHVTQFRKRGEPPLLFVSQCSRFDHGQAIRGGIPIIFPWFGQREGLPHHGFARIKTWDLKEVIPEPDGSVSVRFRLPPCPEAAVWPPFTTDYIVSVKSSLVLRLVVTNDSPDQTFAFENALHTYFEVGDVTAITVAGLQGATYLDQVAGFRETQETEEVIRIASEVDRCYLNSTATVEITDPRLGRKIRVQKGGSLSTVVWNPWIEKSQRIPDFGNDEYERMVCVEAGNIGTNGIKLAPGESSTLTMELASVPLP